MEEKYVDVKGIRTRYLEAGSGESLVLVHGGNFGESCSADDWDLNLAAFARSFHVFAPDKIGCGFSDNPRMDEEYVIGSTVQHLNDFMDVLKIGEAHLIGHSRGGYTVCRLALEHPEKAKTLVVVSSTTLVVPLCPIYYEWNRLAALIKDEGDRERYLAAANSLGVEHITEKFVKAKVKVAALPKSKEASAKHRGPLKQLFLDDLALKQEETHRWIQEGRLKAPTLIMWGYNDPSATFDPIALTTVELLLPNAPYAQMHVLGRAGHYCFREQPEAFNAAAVSFIKSASQYA